MQGASEPSGAQGTKEGPVAASVARLPCPSARPAALPLPVAHRLIIPPRHAACRSGEDDDDYDVCVQVGGGRERVDDGAVQDDDDDDDDDAEEEVKDKCIGGTKEVGE